MQELVAAFKNIIYRDFFYCICGGIIILLLKDYVKLPISPVVGHEFIISILLVGISNVIGYANQELWSQTPFFTTQVPMRYNGFMKYIYKVHTGKIWDSSNIENLFNAKGNHDFVEDETVRRMINQKILGMSMGGCMATSSIILLFRLEYDFAIIGLVLAVILATIGWLKAMQQCARMAELEVR